jgi:hypothetical protein
MTDALGIQEEIALPFFHCYILIGTEKKVYQVLPLGFYDNLHNLFDKYFPLLAN